MRLEGKTALITGASRNIGREIALTFAREGADLVLNTRASQAELDEVAGKCRELGVKTHTVIADVSDSASVSKMVEEGIEALGKIDILVNNVAVRPHKPILEITDEEWHNTLGINMHAAFYLCRAVLPGMMERKTGSIIALGGQSAITGRPGTSIVTTAPYNIRANMVNPGSTDTSRGNPEWYPEFQAGVERGSSEHLKEIPMGRQGTVQDIANACLFFASDESSYITGDSVNVMGGRYIF